MKKNLSFLSKVGVTAASTALVAGFAWADGLLTPVGPGHYADEAAPTSKVWTVPSQALHQYEDGTDVTFIGMKTVGDVNTPMVLINDGTLVDGKNAKAFTPANEPNVFKMHLGENNVMTFTGVDNKVIYANGVNVIVDNRELNTETKWTDDGHGNLKNQSSNNYLYFDNENMQFMTSQSQGAVSAYVKTDAYKPVFDLVDYVTDGDNVNVHEVTEGGVTTTYLRYSSNATATANLTGYQNAKIVLSQANGTGVEGGSKYYIEYGVGTATDEPTTWTNYDAAITLDNVVGTTPADGLIYVWARTVVTDENNKAIDHTAAVKKAYSIVVLDDPEWNAGNGTWDAANKVLTSKANGYASYIIKATGAEAANISATEVLGEDVTPRTGAAASLNQKANFEVTSLTVNVNDIQATKVVDGYTWTTKKYNYEFSLAAYYLKADARGTANTDGFFSYVATPAPGTDAAKALVGADDAHNKITITATSNSNGKAFEVAPTHTADLKFKVQVADGAVEEVTTTVTTNGYEITLPASVNSTTQFNVIVPEGAFKGNTGSANNSRYEVLNKESQPIQYGVQYDKDQFLLKKTSDCGWNNDDVEKAYISYAENVDATHTASFKLFSGSYDSDCTVEPINGAEYAILTKNDGTAITDATAYSISANQGIYSVTFNTNTEGHKILPDGTYILTFPAGTLIDNSTNVKTNMYPVSATIEVKEKVDFDLTLVNESGIAIGENANGICETGNVWVKVVTKTDTEGVHPDFTYDGIKHLSGDRIPVGLASTLANATDDGKATDAKYTIAEANVLKSNFNGNAANIESNNISVFKHFTINADKTTYYVDSKATNFAFVLQPSVTLGTSESMAIASATWKIGELDGTLEVEADGNGTFTLPNDIENGTYKVTIPNTQYTTLYTDRDPCGAEDIELTVVIKDAEFSFVEPTDCDWDELTTHDKIFKVAPKYGLEPNATADDADGVGGEKKVYEIVGDVKTIVGNINTTTNTVTLNDAPTAGQHTYCIEAGSYKSANLDASMNNGNETFTITFKTYVEWNIIPENTKVETSEQGTDVIFYLTAAPVTVGGKNIVPSVDIAKVALVDGQVKVAPTAIVALDDKTVAADGKYAFKATFPQLNPNKYLFNIDNTPETAEDTKGVTVSDDVKTLINTPAEDLYFNFNVYKVVTFAAVNEPALTAVANETAQNIVLKVKATDSEGNERTVSVADLKASEWKINGEAITAPSSIEVTQNKGEYKLSTILNAGTYTVTAPAGIFSVDASTNAELTWTITVDPKAVWFTSPMTANVNYDATSVTFDVDDLQIVSALNYTDNSCTFDADYTKIKLYCDGTEVANGITAAAIDDDEHTLTLTLANALDPDPTKAYYIDFTIGSLTAKDQNISDEHKVNITVTTNFVFYNNWSEDGVDNKYTLNSELPTSELSNVSVSYKQHVMNIGGYQAISLPFDVNYSVFKDAYGDDVKVSRINTIYTEDKDGDGTEETYFVINELKSTEVMYANMPYVLQFNGADGNIELEIENVTLKKGEQGDLTASDNKGHESVQSATTKQSFTFYTVAETFNANTTVAGDVAEYQYRVKQEGESVVWRLRQTTGALQYFTAATTAKNILNPIWTWYAISKGTVANYGKIINGDSDEFTTFINEVNVNNSANDNMYNVSGQRVSKSYKGIIINNGKKYNVK